MKQVEIKIRYEDDNLLIRHFSGNSDTLVLAFTGIGKGMGSIPPDEFVGTAIGREQNSVAFIVDKRRGWYSHKDMIERICTEVTAIAAESGTQRMVSIGNSMGGYGAILLTKWLPIDIAVALSPQVSMRGDVINEHRWEKHRKNLGPNLAHSLVDAIGKTCRYYAVFGAYDKRELAHAALLPDVPNLKILKLPYADHKVAAMLKAAGLQSKMIRAMFERDDKGLDEAIARWRAVAPGMRADVPEEWRVTDFGEKSKLIPKAQQPMSGQATEKTRFSGWLLGKKRKVHGK